MPAILTHDFFGRDALATIDELKGATPEQRRAYLLGCQGPDPLFYLPADPTISNDNNIGHLMHVAHPAKLAESLHNACTMLKPDEQPIGRAWAAGFLSHYALDRVVHPFVYFWQYGICAAGVEGLGPEDGQVVHAEVERDLDEMVLYSKLGLTIRDYRPYQQALIASDDTLDIASRLLFYMGLWTYNKTLQLDTYTHAVKAFRLVQRALYAPRPLKRSTFATIERVAGRQHSLLRALSHRPRAQASSDFDNAGHATWENPFTHERSTESFWGLYERALVDIPQMVSACMAQGFDFEAAVELTHNINFEGEVAE